MKSGKKIIALLMSLFVLVSMIVFVPAKADAASTKTVYVITKKVTKYQDGAETIKYKHTKGLVVGYTRKLTGATSFTEKYKMTLDNKYRPVKSTYTTSGNTYTYKFTLDKKGRVKTSKDSYGTKQTYKYNSKGYLTKVAPIGTKYTWDSKGRLTKMRNGSGNPTVFTYDEKGNLLSVQYPDTKDTFVNTYKNGRLAKTVKTHYEVESNTVYTYKKVKVPANLYKKVLAQQNLIKLNNAVMSFAPFEAMNK